VFEILFNLVLGEADPNLFKVNLERHCDDRGMEVIQFTNMGGSKIMTRIRGSKRNLMNLLDSYYYENDLKPVIESEGEISECFKSGS
jgi:hypothetical protein